MPANATGRTAPPIFRRKLLSAHELQNFEDMLERDGFVLLDGCLTEDGAAGLAAELLKHPDYRAWADGGEGNRGQVRGGDNPRYGMRPWNDKGPWSVQLFDAPLVRQLLGATMRRPYHICHTTFSVGHPGAQPIGFHQDHHHFNHRAPVNLYGRDGHYVQMLYYPHGFNQFDGGLEVLPGSHKVEPEEYKAALAREGIHDMADAPATATNPARPHLPKAISAKFGLKPLALPSASPGSMVFLNARCYHGVAAQMRGSPLPYRLFVNMIFKEGDGTPSGGPPHRAPQALPLSLSLCACVALARFRSS